MYVCTVRDFYSSLILFFTRLDLPSPFTISFIKKSTYPFPLFFSYFLLIYLRGYSRLYFSFGFYIIELSLSHGHPCNALPVRLPMFAAVSIGNTLRLKYITDVNEKNVLG